MKTAVLTAFCLLIPVFGPAAAQPQTDEVFMAGEELTYSVKWKFIRLGRIIIRTSIDTTDTDLVHSVMFVESAPGLPFISITEVNRSLISRRTSKTLGYVGTHRNGDDSVSIEYLYDAGTKSLTVTQKDLATDAMTQHEVRENIPPFVEGNTLLFYARWRSRSGKSFRVPTVVDGKLGYTHLVFDTEVESVELDAVPWPVPSRKYYGRADWNGGTAAGLTGEFTGWVSDDMAAVPLRAEMKIALGSITIELEQWKRDGWAPPGHVALTLGEGGDSDD